MRILARVHSVDPDAKQAHLQIAVADACPVLRTVLYPELKKRSMRFSCSH
jgi:hypothetical protein